MSDLDYDALRKVAEAATPEPWRSIPARDGLPAYLVAGGVVMGDFDKYTRDATHAATFDPPTVLRLLDLAQRAEAAEAAVERVRAMADRADSTSHMNGDSFGAVISTDDLRAALDPQADQ